MIGIHHWYKSQTLRKPIACAVCSMKTKHYKEYTRLVEDRNRSQWIRKIDP